MSPQPKASKFIILASILRAETNQQRSPLNTAKLKDKARKFEQKDQPERAISVYMQILSGIEGTPEMDHELALYNKVGDLYLKNNEVNSAVDMYERAAHKYVEAGLPNNAIALCNKILRYAPGRTAIYLMLGELMLERGFGPQAHEHLLEYVSRMSRAGDLEAAYRPLVKLANGRHGNDAIRAMVVEQLELAAQRTGLLVTMEEHMIQGGFGSACLEALSELGLDGSRLIRLGFADHFPPHAKREELLTTAFLTPEACVSRIMQEIPSRLPREV